MSLCLAVMFPLIVGQDALCYGLAAVMGFGLGAGAVLTPGVVPVLYSLAIGVRPSPAGEPHATAAADGAQMPA